MNPLRRLAFPLVTALAMLAAPACSNNKLGPEDLCERYVECFEDQQLPNSNGTDFYDTCVDSLEQQLEALDGDPCEDPFEDMIDCMAENMTCDDLGQSACRDESNDYNECQGGGYDDFN
jgi:hypothetical protein